MMKSIKEDSPPERFTSNGREALYLPIPISQVSPLKPLAHWQTKYFVKLVHCPPFLQGPDRQGFVTVIIQGNDIEQA